MKRTNPKAIFINFEQRPIPKVRITYNPAFNPPKEDWIEITDPQEIDDILSWRCPQDWEAYKKGPGEWQKWRASQYPSPVHHNNTKQEEGRQHE